METSNTTDSRDPIVFKTLDPSTAVTSKLYQLKFSGNGLDLFGIQIVNLLLTAITLGFYYPWAKAKLLRYMYGATEFEGSNLQFHGTGAEMFKGFIKAVLIIAGIYGVGFFFILVFKSGLGAFIGILCLYGGLAAIIPLAIHGSYRYRMSRTSWRGIRFGYRGNRGELVKLFFRDVFLTLITFGIYGAWFTTHLREYIISHVRFGSVQFKWRGDGATYFGIYLLGYILTIITLGIYVFWWQKNLFEFFVNNLSMEKDGTRIQFVSKATAGGFAGLLIVNVLILLFTFGLGAPWVIVRTINFALDNIEMRGNVDVNQIVQTEQNYKDATGEDIADFFDFDFVI